MDSVLRKLFSGKGFRKTETNVFEILRDSEFRPRGGRVWEGIRAEFWDGKIRVVFNAYAQNVLGLFFLFVTLL